MVVIFWENLRSHHLSMPLHVMILGVCRLNDGRRASSSSTLSFNAQVSVFSSSMAPISLGWFRLIRRRMLSSDSSPFSGAFHARSACALRPYR